MDFNRALDYKCFLWNLPKQRRTDVTSFSMRFEKRRRGLLREAFHSEGERASGFKRGGGEGKVLSYAFKNKSLHLILKELRLSCSHCLHIIVLCSWNRFRRMLLPITNACLLINTNFSDLSMSLNWKFI